MKPKKKKIRLTLFLILILNIVFSLSGLTKTIPVNSSKGLKLLKESLNLNFTVLNNNYETQKNLSYCGIASAVMVLNSLIKSKAPLTVSNKMNFQVYV